MAEYNKSGIYKIVNGINNKIYIGSAVIFRKRWDLHRLELRNNCHHSKYLQNAYNKQNGWGFEFKIIEFVEDKTKLIEREQYWVTELKPDYNVCKIVTSRLGVKSSPEHIAKIVAANTGQKRSKETCIKIGLAKKGLKISEERKEARRNYRHTDEAKQKIASRRGWKHSELSKEKMRISKWNKKCHLVSKELH